MQIPALDRRVRFDERSRSYGIAPFVAGTPRRKTIWRMPKNFPLNQGTEGACVGFGWSGELACEPIVIPADKDRAMRIYRLAREVDQAAGLNFPDGASLLAGAQVCKSNNWIIGYRWAFGIQDVIDTLCAKGPVLLGIPWYESMYTPEYNGLIRVNGQIAGGHCILATGYWPDHPQLGNVIELTNSWGRSYGIEGRGYIREIDLAALLKQDGEACIATDVTPGPKPWWMRFLEKW